MTNEFLWQTKLAARIHDPAEKALVLLRDPAGHEGGSIVGIGEDLGFETRMARRRDGSEIKKLKLSAEMERVVRQADHWAAAADRAQFTKDENERFVSWAQVRFAEEGEIVNPLSGERYSVEKIGQDVLAAHIKAASENLFKRLIHKDPDGNPDYSLTTLAFWRIGPELGQDLQGVGHLWGLLPADTRTPDHTIWQHLDFTSALAGAIADGSRPALLTVAIGPVQEFIAAGRSTSDLWAGSHFLSTLAWQAMQVIAADYGPDAILFPQLRGVPAVDLWLIEQGVAPTLFDRAVWNDTATDYNPLFMAALPNKFVALVPERAGAILARRIRENVQAWVKQEARAMLDQLLGEIGETPDGQHCYTQLEEQLGDFPEVHWCLVPWLPQDEMEAALVPFYPVNGRRPGLFGSDAWQSLTAPIEPERGWRFWEPNDGTLYPAVYDMGERLLAAAKSTRPFNQLEQRGYRDALTGEYEWLTLENRQLDEGSPRQRTDTLWARVAKERPAWSKGDGDGRKAEHLSAFGLIKRLWPERFPQIVRGSRWYQQLKNKPDLSRYVVSTHVMALAPTLERLMRHGPAEGEKAREAFAKLEKSTARLKRPALPRRLMRRELRDSEWWETATRLPALLEQARERAGEAEEEERVDKELSRIETALGVGVERYYALLLMDGDRLGSWLSGDYALTFGEVFHTRVKAGLAGYRHEQLDGYLGMQRPVSPSRHMAISSALNGFALDLVRHVVEDECLGKVLYAGGDDVMAMLSVRDVLKAMALLRTAYSGGLPEEHAIPIADSELELKRGFVQWQGRLYQVMGDKATASCGAVVAHHQAPLAAVLRELRAAEKRAKSYHRPGNGGTMINRDAFHITIVKRSGGALNLSAEWGEALMLLGDLRAFLADKATSPRAVYNTLEWLTDVPDPKGKSEILESLLAYQLAQQSEGQTKAQARKLAERLSALAAKQDKDGLGCLQNFMSVAEFLARETRAGDDV
jgi:CRISPR-associated protein Cmr2